MPRTPERLDYIASVATVLVVAVLVGGSLAVTDAVIRLFRPDHAPMQSPVAGAFLFLLFGTPFALYMRVRQWTRLLPTLIAAYALLIPIAFFATVLVCWTDPTRCPGVMSNNDGNGPAFARMVYFNTLRALPTVVLVPFAYWFVLTRAFERTTRARGGHDEWEGQVGSS